ncbi:MAG TPA: hypothetical protein VLH12_08805 [Usitatibacter sp.]|nr:hypothetical protein [Usitatibacter sp.]
MQEMIATSEIEYPPGKCWKPGDTFAVEDDHVQLLQTLGRAKLPESKIPAETPRRGPGRPRNPPKAQ